MTDKQKTAVSELEKLKKALTMQVHKDGSNHGMMSGNSKKTRLVLTAGRFWIVVSEEGRIDLFLQPVRGPIKHATHACPTSTYLIRLCRALKAGREERKVGVNGSM